MTMYIHVINIISHEKRIEVLKYSIKITTTLVTKIYLEQELGKLLSKQK